MIPECVDIKSVWNVLPPGIHDATLDEIEQRFAANDTRKRLYKGFRKGVEALQKAGCKVVYLDGAAAMITNERQYRITKARLSDFQKAVTAYDLDEATKRIGSSVLAKAELKALKSETEVLSEQIQEYDDLKSGAVTILRAENLDELPSILIRARIARGLSQRQLAGKLNLKEQQIQRYESDQYASASLRRLTEVARALHLKITEVAELSQHPL